jgi:hypothetical protein
MRMIRQELAELQQKCHYFLCFSMRTLTYPGFSKKNFPHNQKTSTIIYHSIENFAGYKMVLQKSLRNNGQINLGQA